MNDTMCYAARFPGKPGYGAVMVDLPEYRQNTASEIAKLIREGATIERVSVEAGCAGISEYFADMKRRNHE